MGMVCRRVVLSTLVVWMGVGLPGCGNTPRSDKAPRPNILLITLDTTRKDHLSCYGHARETTPRLDELARESVKFSRAYSTTSWSLPSHASLFTGKFPSSHGAHQSETGNLILSDAVDGPDAFDALRARGIGNEERTLASILSEEGYQTCGVVAGPWMKTMFGLNVGFETYHEEGITELNGRPAVEVTDTAVNWLDSPAFSSEEPFFLFLNYFDAHLPYKPPVEFRNRFVPAGTPESSLLFPSNRQEERFVANLLYDAEILAVDHHMGRLFDELRKRGLYENTLIIVTADHGELIGEHNQSGHGFCLYEEEIQIPLVVRDPGSKSEGPTGARGSTNDSPIQLPDVFTLVLDHLGLPYPQGIQGQRLGEITHPIYSESYLFPPVFKGGSWRSLHEGKFKLIWNSKGNHRLYNLEKDPGETRNLAKRAIPRVESMTRKIESMIASWPPPGDAGPEKKIDEETMRALEKLGYKE